MRRGKGKQPTRHLFLPPLNTGGTSCFCVSRMRTRFQMAIALNKNGGFGPTLQKQMEKFNTDQLELLMNRTEQVQSSAYTFQENTKKLRRLVESRQKGLRSQVRLPRPSLVPDEIAGVLTRLPAGARSESPR